MRIGVAPKPVITAALYVAALARAQTQEPNSAPEHWVATWATAQELANFSRPGLPPRARAGGPEASNLPATFAEQTVRMIVRVSLGGPRLRVELSNMLGAQPLEIGAAHIGLHSGRGAVAEGTDRVLTFGGRPSFTIPPGVLAVSDAVTLDVAPLSDLAVSLYLPHDTGPPTSHTVGLHTAYISKGDVTSSPTIPNPATMLRMPGFQASRWPRRSTRSQWWPSATRSPTGTPRHVMPIVPGRLFWPSDYTQSWEPGMLP